MEALATVVFSLAVVAYSVATTEFFLALSRPGAVVRSSTSSITMGVGAIMHALHIVIASFLLHTCPVASMRFVLSLAALVAVISFLILRAGRRIDALGAFVGPLALLLLISSEFVETTSVPPQLSRVLLMLHVAANLFGLGFVLLAAGTSTFYLVVERRLRAKNMSGLGRLPALDVLDRLGHRLLLIGFPLLSFGCVTGGMFLHQLDVNSPASLARAVLGYAAWVMVFVVLLQRALLGFSGRRSAYGTLAGALCIALMLMVYLVRPLLGVGA
ncbi:MAG TPA: cytochrome c biogenesis protein CcsA [Polyangiaceae bacterium]|jgi:ABC-type uncharacterized transport system permease subunit|nr:cytochrome c biogenesis protein CcsA [Polyangiaceae bacterium]